MNKRDFIYRKGKRDEDLCVQGSHFLLAKGRVTLSLLLLATYKGRMVTQLHLLFWQGRVPLSLSLDYKLLPHAT